MERLICAAASAIAFLPYCVLNLWQVHRVFAGLARS